MSWDGGKNVQTRAELEEAEQCTCGHTRVAHEDNVGFCWDCDAWVTSACCQGFVKHILKDGPVAHDGGVCDCETPGDWHRVANDFQRAMFEERARAEKAEDDLIVRHEQLQEALDQLELFFDPRERNDANIDAGDILRKHRRVGPRMERGRPDDELEAALDADNPDPPLAT